MIVVRLMGGFANQLFQYATGRAIAIQRNEELFLDLSYLNADPKGAYTKREYQLNQINIQAKIADFDLIKEFESKGVIDKVINKIGLKSHSVFNEFQSNYIPEIKNLPQNVLLNGYWQSERYFVDIRPQLISEILPSYEFTISAKDYIDLINESNSVGIHVRRGDYVHLKHAADFHGNCDLNYYMNAVKLLNTKHTDLKYFVFSDDLDWCKRNLVDIKQVVFVESELNQNSSQDLFLISKCKHQIIANSSYSWWAAWLNQYSSKQVIAPKKWFNDHTINTSDLIPKSWLTI